MDDIKHRNAFLSLTLDSINTNIHKGLNLSLGSHLLNEIFVFHLLIDIFESLMALLTTKLSKYSATFLPFLYATQCVPDPIWESKLTIPTSSFNIFCGNASLL